MPAAESDTYELLVNPTMLTLVEQRGNIDCGGLRYVLIWHGNFFQLVTRAPGSMSLLHWSHRRTWAWWNAPGG